MLENILLLLADAGLDLLVGLILIGVELYVARVFALGSPRSGRRW
jgi:hypothetical protein